MKSDLPSGKSEQPNLIRGLHALRIKAGLDRAVGTTVLFRASQGLSTALLLFLVARTLSQVEQGFYFTLNSVAALQIFFELGLTFVLMQFASHEAARLTKSADGTYAGNADSHARLASLIRFGMAWYSVASLLLLILILPLGIVYFAHFSASAPVRLWMAPWLLLVGATACTLVFNSVIALFEGCGEVADVAQLRVRETLCGTAVAIVLLLAGAKLYAASALVLCDALMQAWWLIGRRTAILSLWRAYNPAITVKWLSEIWPFQWKIAVSWLSGYFIFQIFTPVLFALSGPVQAGKMGLTLSACTGLSTLGMSWVYTKSPRMGAMISLGQRRQLDEVFFSSLKSALSVAAGLAIVFWCGIVALQFRGVDLANRFLEPVGLALTLAATLAACVTSAQAVYLRAHKQEPFLPVSILSAVINTVLAFTLASAYGSRGVAAGYAFTSIVVGLGLGSYVFIRHRTAYGASDRAAADLPTPVRVPEVSLEA